MPAIQYTIAITQPHDHLVDVRMVINDLSGPTVQIQLPTWTPGSYLIREYARHVRQLRAEGPHGPLAQRKLDKLTWEFETGGASSVTVHYQVYGYELTVRTNHIDPTHAHLTPAATFMFVPGREQAAAHIQIIAPAGWQIATGLDQVSAADSATFMAHNFDQLIDSPFEIGLHQRHQFTVDGKSHALVIWGQGNEDTERLVADAQRIVETQRDFWGELPYEHYTFFLLLGGPEAGGGLEHRNSTTLLLPRHIFKPAKSYERYLSLTSHEFFHTWNVKRLRTAPLGPFDYTTENYTKLLWVMEGFTEYYTDLMLVRAGLISAERYCERLAEDIITLQATPGRLLHSLSAASFDTWTKFYRPDETTPNTTISYYLKGALAGLILDMLIRERTQGDRSLDDLMSYLYRTYPDTGPGIPEDAGMLRALQSVAPGDWDWAEFFELYIDGVEEYPFERTLATVGLELRWSHNDTAEGSAAPQPKLGARLKARDGRIQLTHVLHGGDAEAAGLAPNDELLAINGWRIDEGLLQQRLADYTPGETVQITFFRSDVLQTLPLTFTSPPPDSLALVASATSTTAQRQAYRQWLGQPLVGEPAPAEAAATSVGTEEILRTSEG